MLLKKVICIFLIFTICLFGNTGKLLNYNNVYIIQAYADDETSEEDDTGFFESISNALSSIADTIGTVIDSLTSLVYSDHNVAAPLLITMTSGLFFELTSVWSSLMDDVVADDIFSSNLLFGRGHMVFNIATSLSTFAVGIFMIAVALELRQEIKKSDGEPLTLKRFTSALARVMPGFVWILASYWVCKCIVYINQGMVNVVADLFPTIDELFGSLSLDEDSFGEGLGIGYIGYLLDLLDGLIKILPMIVAILVLIVIGWIVGIKLKMRQIEICCMMAISPLFFACASSDAMQEYFKKFIMSFISVVIQTLFMAIVILVGMTWFNDEVLAVLDGDVFLITGDRTLVDFFGDIFIIIAMGVMLIKPPAVLQNLVRN